MVNKINKNLEADRAKSASGGMELWLKDGDNAFVALIASGEPNDARLDDFYVHGEPSTGDSGKRMWRTFFCNQTVGERCDKCEADNKPGHQFGIWCYVYYVLHAKRDNPSWEEKTSASGETKYKENVNDFRVFARGFGMRQYLWDQLVDIFNEEGNLTKKIVRIRRTGSGQNDTSFGIILTGTKVTLSEEAIAAAAKLSPIKDFFKKKYAPLTVAAVNADRVDIELEAALNIDPDKSAEDELGDLF